MKNSTRGFLFCTLILLLSGHWAYGDSATWTGGTDATWANAGNWTANPPSQNDTATFSATITNGNGTTSPVVIDSGRSINSIIFDTSAASAYTIGTTTGYALMMNGGIEITSTVVNVETINAPLILGTTGSSDFFISNNASDPAAVLDLGGSIIGQASVGNSTTLFLQAPSTLSVNTISGAIGDGSGGGTVNVFVGSGVWAFTGPSAFSGGTGLNGGGAQIILGNNTSLGTGTLTLNNGTISASTTLTNIANNIVDVFNPVIGGSNAMTFTGSFTNSGNNQTLSVNNTGTTTFSGNTIYLSEAAGTGRTLTVNGSGNVVIDDVISDFDGAGTSGNFNYTGTGSLVLAGNNTFTGLATFGSGNNTPTNGTVTISGDNTAATGGVTLNNGYLLLDNAQALGSGTLTINGGFIDNVTGASLTETNNPAVVIANGFNFTGTNDLNLGTGAVTIDGSGTANYAFRTITLGDVDNTSLTFGGAVTNPSGNPLYLEVDARPGITGDSLIFNGGFGLSGASATAATTDTFQGSANIVINGGVSDGSAYSNSLVYQGSGTLTLGSAGSYSGTTSLNSGTLILGDNAAMGTSAVFAAGGTIEASTALDNVANNITDTNSFTIGGSNAITLTGTLTADAGNNRTLTINDTGGVTVDGSVYLSNSATQGRNFTITGTGNTVINGVIADFDGAGVSSGLSFGGAGGSGTWTLTNANTYTGGTTVNSGTLVVALAGSGTPLGGGGLTLEGGTVDFAPGGSGADIAYTITGGSFQYGSGTIALNQGSESSLTVTLGNGAPGRANNTQGLLLIAPSAPGALGNTEQLFFGSAPNVNNGMINASIVSVGATTAGMGDFLTYGANGLAVASYTNHSSDFTTGADEIANVTGNANVTTTGAVRGFLVQAGVTATLDGTLDFDGSGAGLILNGGTISGGTINIANGNEADFYAFNAPSTINSQVTISSGGNGTSLVIGGTQTITLNGGLDLNNGDGNVSVAGGGLTITGTTSTNTNFTVNGGTLNLDSSYDNVSSTITVGGLTTSVLTTGAVNAISGVTALTINGGNVFLNSANNYTGATSVGSQGGFDGNLTLTATGAIDGSAVTLVTNGGGILNANAVNAMTGATSLTINNNPNNSDFGTANINAAQNYTGATTVNGGVLNIAGSGTLTQSSVTQNSGTVNLETAGAISQGTYLFVGGALNETTNDAISGTAGLTTLGTNALVISQANNYSGATTIGNFSNQFSISTPFNNYNGNPTGTVFDFSQATSPVDNIVNNGISHADIGTGSTLVMDGGAALFLGKNNTANTQEFNGLSVANGSNFLNDAAGSGTGSINVALNAITRSSGATLDFGPGPGATGPVSAPTGTFTTTSGNTDFTSAGGSNTILGGWAVWGGGTFATVGPGGVIGGLLNSQYEGSSVNVTKGGDVDAGGQDAEITVPSINSLLFSNIFQSGSGDVVFIGGTNGTTVIASGGILVANTNGNPNLIEGQPNNPNDPLTYGFSLTPDAITSGNGSDLIVTQNGGGALTIDANIVNDGSTPIGLTMSGFGTLVLGGVNTFTGPLVINSGTVQLTNAAALNGTTGVAVVFNFTGVSAGTLDLNGNNATVTDLSDDTGHVGLNGGPNLTNNNVGATSTLTINNAANDVYDGTIQNASGATLNLVKTGAGTLDLTAASRTGNGGFSFDYSGTTEIDGGELFLGMTNGVNPTSTTSLLVNGGGSIGSTGAANNTIGNGNGFVATIVGGTSAATRGTIDMTDGIVGGTLAFSGTPGTTSLIIGGTAGNASAINLDVGNGTANQIILGSGRNTQNNIEVNAGGFLVNLVGVGGLNGNAQTILSTAGFDPNSTIDTFTGNVGTGTSILLGATSGNFNGYTVALLGAGDDLEITETQNQLTGSTIYYSGNSSAGGTVSGGTSAWNSFTGGNANNSNFAYTSTTGPDTNQEVNSGSDLHFGAAPTEADALANYTNNTLGSDVTIHSLTYDATVDGNITTTGASNNLTLESATGITDLATGGTQTISTNLLTVGASQTWDVESQASLVVNSAISDGANNYSLTKTGDGALTLGGNSVYSGGTIVNAGTLYANGVSSTGSGQVSVTGPGTLGGLGTVKPTGGTSSSIGVLINAGGTLAPGGMQTGTVANGNLTLDTSNFNGTVGLSLSNTAGLTFALGASNSSSSLVVGATTVAFNDNVVTINDLVGAGLTVGGEYTLIDGTGSTVYTGLSYGNTTDEGTQIVGGLSLLASGSGNFFADFYSTSELFLTGNNDIVVEVVPEPGTWALMLGGFALLVFIQRRKRKQS